MRLALSLARHIRKGPLSGPELRSPRQPCGCALSLSLHSALHPKMQSALPPTNRQRQRKSGAFFTGAAHKKRAAQRP